MQSFDVVVIGAGPGGAAAAHRLAIRGLSVLMVDKAVFPRDKTCGDGLTPRAVGMLQKLGVHDALLPEACRMDEATVFSPAGRPITTKMPSDSGQPNYMLALPRLILDDALRQHAIAAGAHYQDNTRIRGIEEQSDGVVITGQRQGKRVTFRAKSAVIAVGANLKLLLQLGILKETPPLILAARTYFEDMDGLTGRFEFHLDGVPLPGYGWIFPLSATSGNVGAGIMTTRAGKPPNAKKILREFMASPIMERMLGNARQTGPIKGFPLRTDFAHAPTSFGNRVLLVGEAAGLVNPVTGEGIDYALESGILAADCLAEAIAAGSITDELAQRYDKQLRHHFQHLFVFSERLRDWYLHAPILNRLVYVANRRDRLRSLFTNVLLGNADASEATSLKTIAQIIFTV